MIRLAAGVFFFLIFKEERLGGADWLWLGKRAPGWLRLKYTLNLIL
jgi:hypothetical protein